MSKKIKQFNWQVKVLNEQERTIEMVGSTESFDRYNDRMTMVGAKLDNYKKNPVILANHNYGYSEKPSVIGRALDVHVEGNKLIFIIQFAETDNAKDWWYLYSKGFMNASSIGFIPLKYTPNDQGGYDFLEWELLELSLVAVPANQEALQRAFENGKISKAFFNAINKEFEEDISTMEKKELESLIKTSVNAQLKDVNEKHQTELKEKDAEIEKLKGEIKKLEDSQVKSGAKHSKETVDTVTKACSGMEEHIKCLKGLISAECDTDPNDDPEDDEKNYSDEEIQKMIEENVIKTVKAYQSV